MDLKLETPLKHQFNNDKPKFKKVNDLQIMNICIYKYTEKDPAVYFFY